MIEHGLEHPFTNRGGKTSFDRSSIHPQLSPVGVTRLVTPPGRPAADLAISPPRGETRTFSAGYNEWTVGPFGSGWPETPFPIDHIDNESQFLERFTD
jgi:hypothetical protein